MPDRSKIPTFTSDFDISLQGVITHSMEGRDRIYKVPYDGEVIRIDVVFPSGRIDERSRAQNRMCIKTVYEGSEEIDGDSFNEKMDYYGAVTGSQAGMDYSSFSLTLMKKDVAEVLPLWLAMIKRPKFPKDRIAKRVVLAAESLERELAKNNVIAYRELSALIFGKEHPYGYNSMPQDYLDINHQTLTDFYNDTIFWEEAVFVLSGGITDEVVKQIEGCLKTGNTIRQRKTPETIDSNIENQRIVGPQESQATIKLGRRLFPFGHENAKGFQLLNLILGGYFGSRLIRNIREEKGLCYHIDSSIDTMLFDGYFSISADVSISNVNLAVEEIKKELLRLQNEEVSAEEFSIAKNYIKGQWLTLIDGPFAKASLIKNYLRKGANPLKFNNMSDSLSVITPSHLLHLANEYLSIEELHLLIVGS